MKKERVLEKTIVKLTRLTEAELQEAHDFIDFLTSKLEDRNFTAAIQKQAESSNTFHFLEDEEELYKESDLQENYN